MMGRILHNPKTGRQTTLVTLMARSQAFRMAMGVLHQGKVHQTREMRCSACRAIVTVPEEWVERKAVCHVCAERIKQQKRTAKTGNDLRYCTDCGKMLTPVERSGGICMECLHNRVRIWESARHPIGEPVTSGRASQGGAEIIMLVVLVTILIGLLVWCGWL